MPGLETITVPALIPILPAAHTTIVLLALCVPALLGLVVGLRHRSTRRSLLRFCWNQRWGLLVLAVLVWGSVKTGAWIADRLSAPTVEGVAVAGQWTARGGAPRHGRVAGTPSVTTGGVRWVGGSHDVFFSSPASVGDRVYGVGFRGDRGRVYCWDAETGRQLWTAQPTGFRAAFSSPVVSGETLFIGEGLHHTPRSSVFSLDLRPGREGDVRWSFETNGHVECTPVVVADRLFFAAGDDGVYCLDSRDGLDDAERVLWHVSGERLPDVETALAVHEGQVFVGLGAGGEALVILDAEDGTESARLAMPFPVHGLPAIAGNRLFVGMGTGNYVDHSRSRGQIACLDLDAMEILWVHETPGTVLGAVAADDATQEIVFGCADGRVVVLDFQGRQLRDWSSRAPIVTSPAVTDEMVYVVNEAGVLYGLDRRQLTPIWETRLGPPGQYVSSPVVAHGHVYLGTPTEGFLCVGDAEPNRVRPAATLPDRGTVLWTYELPSKPVAPPAVTSIAVVVPVARDGRLRLLSLKNRNSSPPVQTATRQIGSFEDCAIVAADHVAVVAAGSHLMAIDAVTTQTLWQVESTAPDVLAVEGTSVWMRKSDRDDSTSARWSVRSLLDGSLVSESTDRGPKTANELLDVDGSVIIRRGGGDPIVWADCSMLGEIRARPVVFGGRAYVCIGDRLVCLGEADRP